MTSQAGGPVPSFREVFDTYVRYVFRVLLQLGASEVEAEDLCQDVFLVVHRKLPSFEGRSSLKTWLYGIAIRTMSDHRRRAHVRNERATENVPEQRISAPQQRDLERREAKAMLDDALSTLNEERRAVFVLYEVEQLPMREVALALNIPMQTAYSRLYSARAAVTAVFQPSGGTP